MGVIGSGRTPGNSPRLRTRAPFCITPGGTEKQKEKDNTLEFSWEDFHTESEILDAERGEERREDKSGLERRGQGFTHHFLAFIKYKLLSPVRP